MTLDLKLSTNDSVAQLLIEPLLKRLSRLLQKQHNCQFEYKRSSYTKSMPAKTPFMPSDPTSNTAQFTGNKITFPLLLDDYCLGVISLLPLSESNELQVDKIKTVLDLIITPSLESVQKILELKQLEKNYLTTKGSPAEIISKDLSSQMQNRSNSWQPLFQTISATSVSHLPPMLLSSVNAHSVFKAAHHLHKKLHRSSFLTTTVLGLDIFEKIEDLAKLGSVTIFIPEICQLTQQQQDNIADYFTINSSNKKPQIILGSQKSLIELNADPLISPAIIKKISAGYVNLDQCKSEAYFTQLIAFYNEPRDPKSSDRVLN